MTHSNMSKKNFLNTTQLHLHSREAGITFSASCYLGADKKMLARLSVFSTNDFTKISSFVTFWKNKTINIQVPLNYRTKQYLFLNSILHFTLITGQANYRKFIRKEV